jgi:hypothetical protein
MPTLKVNGSSLDVPSLGVRKSFPHLSEKRITKAVRNRLREEYGLHKVTVSCDAEPKGKSWQGRCSINGTFHTWTLR